MCVNSQKQQAGVTLVELLVSVTLGLFILAGVMQLYATTTQNASMVNGNSAIQEHARFLFTKMEADVAKAGYAGCMNFNVDVNRVQSIANDMGGLDFNVAQFIEGEDGVALNDKNFDQFVVHYAGSANRAAVKEANSSSFKVDTTASAAFEQGDIVLAGDCSGFGVFRVSNQPEDSGVIEFAQGSYNTGSFNMQFSDENDILPGITYLYGGSGAFEYYIDTSTEGVEEGAVCKAGQTQYCALYRRSTDANTGDELVAGVDAFEVEYGWRDAATGHLFFADAATVPAANWGDIDRIKISTTLSSPNTAATNEGPDYIQKAYTRTFVFFNQIPEA